MDQETKIYIKGKRRELFSRGLLAKKLEVIGFTLTEGYEFSISVYEMIKNLDKSEITKEEFDKIVYNLLKEQYTKDIAKKYYSIECWRDSSTPIWILVSGGIGVGKSTTSRRIASDLGIQHIIGTNVIRDIMRKILSPEIVPEVHVPSYRAFETLRPIYSSRFDNVIIGFENHAKLVNMGVEAVLHRAETENVSIVIEGEHLLPSFFDKLIAQRDNVIYLTLAVNDPNRHLENIKEQYTSEKEELLKHFNEIRKIHDHLVNESRIRKLPVIEVDKEDNTLKTIREIIVKRIIKINSNKKKV